jgi:hypothetical protein
MRPGDRLRVRGPAGWADALVVVVYSREPGGPWTWAIAQGVGITQYRVEPDQVDPDPAEAGVWRLRWQSAHEAERDLLLAGARPSVVGCPR